MTEQTAHNFDLWGPIVDQWEYSVRKLDLLPRASQLTVQERKKIREEYEALMRGEEWATMNPDKARICHALNDALEKARVEPDPTGIIYPEALAVIREILAADQGLNIYTTKMDEGAGRELERLLGLQVFRKIGIYEGNKTSIEGHQKVFTEEAAKGRRVVSHTADEVRELTPLLEGRLLTPERVIYVARFGGSLSPEQVRAAGIQVYKRDLREKPSYVELGRG